ncbi:root hair defective 3 GTP-binding protein Rhd3 [Chloropicon primus]|uniref:Protein ROOT HAIR DEFECTIVE 3 homolog n=1 Tax=Chloropicon primus TaxID=1764295 RepID=A0A5B8MFP0_9CHLO|nr:root hair defective 3 GTP-binding protein Rhd3 [Chloropicon primus]UPQ98465.1 root hair defective 3 GTP-binding protein Rhd3 [Chloropicon primus]|mmetsp:Transcript_14381/g.30038  ORF Transcript_14381/g.30038 Transcript_14381/m.30038 type:complete len:784 (+) Transcript_14381:68-2419(+)|eukprot:QDZ19256.1 root hair defective 3 GTP-binding protein Rhd3 [Chloropicon primus]
MSAVQIVNGEGSLDRSGLTSLLESCGVEGAGLEYSLIAIMGPQSSGKSTLLNHVFGTSFREMDARSGRSQTTQGIWLAASPKLSDDKTLVLDLEGTDGRERGEDDTNFERQSALFALAVSDVLLINLWHHDVGREHGSGKPLLKTILQENLKLFDSGKKKTLVFVIRDRSLKTPLEALAKTLREDLEKIWNGLSKPENEGRDDGKAWELDGHFDLIFTSLPNYEEKEEEFEAEATLLRSKFKKSNEENYLPSEKSVPGSALSMSMDQIWSTIKENKNLDLPAHRVMVATVRCDQSILELSHDFSENAEVKALEDEASASLLGDYGSRCKGVVETYLSRFDDLVEFFEDSVIASKRLELTEKLGQIMSGATSAQNDFCRMDALSFYGKEVGALDKDKFAERAAKVKSESLEMFDTSVMNVSITDETPKEVEDLRVRLEGEILAIYNARIKDLKSLIMESMKKVLSKALYMPFTNTFEDLPEDTWGTLRSVKTKVMKEQCQSIEEELGGLGLDADNLEGCREELTSFGKERYTSLIEESVKSAPKILKDKFVKSFCYDGKGTPRVWGPKVDVGAINLDAKKEAAKALCLLTVSQIEKEQKELTKVEEALDTLTSSEGSDLSPVFASDSWPGVEKECVLLDPMECRSVWRQMESEVSYTISQAVTAHEAAKQASNRGPPLWTIIAMVLLGWNEIMSVLYNPLLLIFLVLLFVFGRAVWLRIDIGSELEKGFIPALVSISLKITPILIEVCQQFAWQVKEAIEKNAEAGKPKEKVATNATPTSKKDD